MRKKTLRAARIALQVMELFLLIAFLAIPGSSFLFIFLAVAVEAAAIILEVIGLQGLAARIRAAKKFCAAHGRTRAKKWAWSALGLWWFSKSFRRPKK